VVIPKITLLVADVGNDIVSPALVVESADGQPILKRAARRENYGKFNNRTLTVSNWPF